MNSKALTPTEYLYQGLWIWLSFDETTWSVSDQRQAEGDEILFSSPCIDKCMAMINEVHADFDA